MNHAIERMESSQIRCACGWRADLPADMRTFSKKIKDDRLLDYYNSHRFVQATKVEKKK